MTIRRGEQWGRSASVPRDVVRLGSDAELAQTDPSRVVVLSGGDIWESIGRPDPRDADEPCTIVEIDAMVCHVVMRDGSDLHIVAASSVEIGSWIRPGQRYVCVTNSGIVRGRRLAPRAHPNDGRLAVMSVDATMSARQRLLSRRLARTGSHLPHPSINVSHTDRIERGALLRRDVLSIDGRRVTGWASVTVTAVPDHWSVVV